MKFKLLLVLASIAILSTSCNDKENKDSKTENTVENTSKNKLTKAEKEENKKKANSVMVKAIRTQEVSTFTSALATLELTETLSNPSKKYTLFAPSNKAFEVLGEGQTVLNDPTKREQLKTLIESHIAVGATDSATIFQQLEKSGNYTLPTLNGNKILFKKAGDDILATNESGAEAKIGKSDIKGANGVLHVIDGLLQQ